MEGWIIIQTFINTQDAYMARSLLEAGGIETLMQDELTAQTGYYSNAIGGVKLLIREDQLQEGLRVLEEAGYIDYTGEEQAEDWEWVDKQEKTHCPFCHSDNIGKSKNLKVASIILFFVLGIFFPLFRRTWKCFDCHKTWKYR